MKVLVLNCGSSSIKFRAFDAATEREICSGAVEGIGAPTALTRLRVAGACEERGESPVPDHAAAVSAACDRLARPDALGQAGPDVVAHRVVHGGERFAAATEINDTVLAEVERLTPLAPLHNPANLIGVRLAQQRYPAARHVAAFDTAFHQTIPAHASVYALERELATRHGLRRYGFHGASHRWASARVAELLGRPLGELRTVVLHLGAGASATAVAGGVSIDTSMGMTPLEGLVMATRCGDLDPGVVLYLLREAGMTADGVDQLLNRRSGLAGLCGDADMRAVLARAKGGDPEATLAVDAYVYRIAKQVGAYAVALGGLDAVVFTAGVGERSAPIRAAVAAHLAALGAEIDSDANDSVDGDAVIHAAGSRVALAVVAANEELQIAREAIVTLGGGA